MKRYVLIRRAPLVGAYRAGRGHSFSVGDGPGIPYGGGIGYCRGHGYGFGPGDIPPAVYPACWLRRTS